jgi:adenosylcobyric acid synthase
VSGGLLIAGTTSDAGKSVLTAGICRWLARQGVKVAPFKAQNMSLNSAVTRDGAEIGRAQAMQAAAAGIEPEAVMNPILLKPGSDRTSQVVVLGRPIGDTDAVGYPAMKARLQPIVLDALRELRSRFDVVICEGAGSPAEINLRGTDLANMGLARAADLPVVVVADIDRGGAFAAMFGTLALLSDEDQALVAGFVVNKFRGDPAVLTPGLTMLTGLTSRPVLGVVPHITGLRLDAEDSLALENRPPAVTAPPVGEQVLRVAVIRLPLISNFTDADALAAEPGVQVRFVTTPDEVADADLVIIPGTRATVADLAWLRRTGLASGLIDRADAGRPILGICGGFQMLAAQIVDEVESRAGTVTGLGLLPVTVAFGSEKVLGRPSGSAYGEPVHGYEIHHGRVEVDGGAPFLDGCRVGAVWGTSWHGTLENDGFRRALLRDVATVAGRRFEPAPDVRFAALREQQLDELADLVSNHLDTAALMRLIEDGPPVGLPAIAPGTAGPISVPPGTTP